MLKTRNYFIIALAVYCLTILVQLPASVLILPLAKNLDQKVFSVQNVSGTLWQGQLQAELEQQFVDVSWDWHLWQLLLFSVNADVHIKSAVLEAKSEINLAPGALGFDGFSGLVKSQALNALLKDKGVNAQIENDIYLKNLSLHRGNGTFVSASGQASWEGGLIRAKDLPDGKAEFPSLLANVNLEESGLNISLVEAKNQDAMILDIFLSHNGQAHLRLREQVDQYVKVPSQLLRGNSENVMFEIKRQIFDTKGRF